MLIESLTDAERAALTAIRSGKQLFASVSSHSGQYSVEVIESDGSVSTHLQPPNQQNEGTSP